MWPFSSYQRAGQDEMGQRVHRSPFEDNRQVDILVRSEGVVGQGHPAVAGQLALEGKVNNTASIVS